MPILVLLDVLEHLEDGLLDGQDELILLPLELQPSTMHIGDIVNKVDNGLLYEHQGLARFMVLILS